VIMRAISLLMLIVVGCGARQHHEDITKVQTLSAQISEREKAEEKKKQKAIADMALEQRQMRIEVADIKRTNAQMLAEMETESR